VPVFSIIVATYNRGRHIKPTIESALAQSLRDWELIVVGDGCTDDTLNVVRSFGSPKVVTLEIARNSGSQSAPNNLGIARSKGSLIAYLGHDDVWCPDHLAKLAASFSRAPRPDVVATGCVFHGPQDSGISFVTGMLDEDHSGADHFLPPSALAHTRDLIERIGQWPSPEDVAAPVDCEIMLRAARAGAAFASTGEVTVHKFAAGHRYLSYLRPASWEQAAMLETLRTGDRADRTAFVEAARAQGGYMVMKHIDFEGLGKGKLFEANRSNKGLRRAALRTLEGRVVLCQTAEPRGLDWHELEQSSQLYRWSGPSPTPHVLIPYRGDGMARLTLHVAMSTPAEVLDALSFDHDGRTISHTIDASRPHWAKLEVDLPLRIDDYSILGITTPRMFCPLEQSGSTDDRRLGIALGNIEIEPLSR
jgi:glycosyltransferase involved in cell wall biosynthesis